MSASLFLHPLLLQWACVISPMRLPLEADVDRLLYDEVCHNNRWSMQ